MNYNLIRSLVLILLGFLTIPMLEILPVAGGGKAMIIVITIPLIIIVSIIMTIIYNVRFAKMADENAKKTAFAIMAMIMLVLNVLLFPHR